MLQAWTKIAKINRSCCPRLSISTMWHDPFNPPMVWLLIIITLTIVLPLVPVGKDHSTGLHSTCPFVAIYFFVVLLKYVNSVHHWMLQQPSPDLIITPNMKTVPCINKSWQRFSFLQDKFENELYPNWSFKNRVGCSIS